MNTTWSLEERERTPLFEGSVLASGPVAFLYPSLALVLIIAVSVVVSLYMPLRGELAWDLASEKYIRVQQRISAQVVWFRSNVLFGMWLSYSDLATDILVGMIFLEHGHERWFACNVAFIAIPTAAMIIFDVLAPAPQVAICNSRALPIVLDLTRLRVAVETFRSLRTNERAQGDKFMSMAQVLGSLPQLILQLTWVLMMWKDNSIGPNIKAAVLVTSVACSLLATSVGVVATLEQAIWPLFFEVGVFWERLEISPWFRHAATLYFFLDVGTHSVALCLLAVCVPNGVAVAAVCMFMVRVLLLHGFIVAADARHCCCSGGGPVPRPRGSADEGNRGLGFDMVGDDIVGADGVASCASCSGRCGPGLLVASTLLGPLLSLVALPIRASEHFLHTGRRGRHFFLCISLAATLESWVMFLACAVITRAFDPATYQAFAVLQPLTLVVLLAVLTLCKAPLFRIMYFVGFDLGDLADSFKCSRGDDTGRGNRCGRAATSNPVGRTGAASPPAATCGSMTCCSWCCGTAEHPRPEWGDSHTGDHGDAQEENPGSILSSRSRAMTTQSDHLIPYLTHKARKQRYETLAAADDQDDDGSHSGSMPESLA